MKNLNKSSYVFFITKSSTAAHLMVEGLRRYSPWSKQGGETITTSTGCVNEDTRIPAIYHGQDKFYACIEYRNGEDFNNPEYTIVIC